MYFPSLDQSLGTLSRSSCTMIFSSCVPSEFLIYRSNMSWRLEENTNCAASGLQTGPMSMAGSNVSRLTLSRCNSYVQTSVFWLPTSVLSTATDLPLGAMDTLPYTSGLPTRPTSLPFRSNQTGCESATWLPVWATSRPPSEIANNALPT